MARKRKPAQQVEGKITKWMNDPARLRSMLNQRDRTIAQLKEDLEDAYKMAAPSLNVENKELRELIDAKDKEINAVVNQNAKLSKTILNQDRVIKKMTDAAAVSTGQLQAELDKVTKTSLREIKKLAAERDACTKQLAEAQKTLEWARGMLATKDAEIKNLKAQPAAPADTAAPPVDAKQAKDTAEPFAEIIPIDEARKQANGMPAIGLKMHVDSMYEQSSAIIGRINGIRCIVDVKIRDDHGFSNTTKPRRCVDVVVSEAPPITPI